MPTTMAQQQQSSGLGWHLAQFILILRAEKGAVVLPKSMLRYLGEFLALLPATLVS